MLIKRQQPATPDVETNGAGVALPVAAAGGAMRFRGIDYDHVPESRISGEVAEDHGITLEDQLAEAGFTDEQIANCRELVECEAERRGFHRAAEAMHIIGEKLRGYSQHSAAVALALGIGGTESFGELATRFGITKQAQQQLSAKLHGVFAATTAREEREIERPAVAGEWITRVEARELCIPEKFLADKSLKTETVGHRKFYLRDELLARVEAAKIAQAKAGVDGWVKWVNRRQREEDAELAQSRGITDASRDIEVPRSVGTGSVESGEGGPVVPGGANPHREEALCAE